MKPGAVILWLALVIVPAHAAVYSHVDPVSGMTIVNNVPPDAIGKTAQRAMPVVRSTFPSISPQRQRQMDGSRRAILEDELAGEQQALDVAVARRAAADVLARHMANLAALRRELATVPAMR